MRGGEDDGRRTQAGLTHSRSLILDRASSGPRSDEEEIIGTGFHERAGIDPARFLVRLEKKAAG